MSVLVTKDSFSFATFLKYLLHITVVSLWTLLVFDSFRNPNSSAKILGVTAVNLVIPFFIFQFILRHGLNISLDKKVEKVLLQLVIPLFTCITLVLSVIDFVTPPNAVYNWTQLHQTQLGVIAIFSTIVYLINRPKTWYQKYWKPFIVLLPFVVLSWLFIVRMWPFDVFKEIVKEDKLIEYSQFLVLALGAITSLKYGKVFWEKNLRNLSIIVCLIGLGLLVVAGDEISWGQRILGIQTPAEIVELNRQEEITIHNLYTVEWLVGASYLSLSHFGLTARPLSKILFPKKTTLISLTPSHFLSGYFLLPFVFYFENARIFGGKWHEWSEVSELFLYSGTVLWLLITFHNLLHKKR